MSRYYARICWNTNGWRFPSGDAANLEAGTYAADNKFGHEEWLFNFSWLYDGYHYAFLQGVNQSGRGQQRRTIDIVLWCIDANKRRVYVGKIDNCEVLTQVESFDAYDMRERDGSLSIMRMDVLQVRGKVSEVSRGGLFNIRFRPSDAVQYDPRPVAGPTERIFKLSRYKLVEVLASENDQLVNLRRRRRRSTMIPKAKPRFRKGSNGGTVETYHLRLQEALLVLLENHFGRESVLPEEDWVDITVHTKKRRILVELKTHAVARQAIREAIGQILDYAYFWPEPKLVTPESFIAAPGVLDLEAIAYLRLLNERFGIPVRYCQFLPNSDLPEAFLQPWAT